jgi:hypothetical protein
LLATLSLLGISLAILAATATAADAKRLPYPPGFTIEASNGYSAFVYGVPAWKGHPATLAIFVTGKNRGAFYSTPATVTKGSIQATLGPLGEIAVTFRPSSKAKRERPECGGEPYSVESGYYEGTIAFRGEEEFTQFEATRVPGDLGFLTSFSCPGVLSGGTSGPFEPGAKLDINAHGSRLGPHLTIIKNGPKARAHYEVEVGEVHDEVTIVRAANLIAPATTFTYDPKVRTAMIRPPAPFSGHAKFSRNAKPANRWTGNLAVDLPGRAGVMLTGDNLRTKLVHAHWEWNIGSK